MAEINWLVGEAKMATATERICPGRYILQTEWRSGWNEVFPQLKYDYISDYECIFPHPNPLVGLDEDDRYIWGNLQAAKKQGFGITIKNVAHFTQPAAADKIIDSGGFIGGIKKIDEDENGAPVRECFSWWSPIFDNDTIDRVKQHLQKTLGPFLQRDEDFQNIASQFASSNAFFPYPVPNGNVYFKYTIAELCNFYEAFIQDNLQYRVLGTFLYKGEIVHAVLICGEENGDDLFSSYPQIQNQRNVVTRDDGGNWTWYPQATGTEIIRLHRYHQIYPIYRRWEHVAFAFHMPQGKIMSVGDFGGRRHVL